MCCHKGYGIANGPLHLLKWWLSNTPEERQRGGRRTSKRNEGWEEKEREMVRETDRRSDREMAERGVCRARNGSV